MCLSKRVPYFKPGKELKELINRDTESNPAVSDSSAGPAYRSRISPDSSSSPMHHLWAPWRLSYVTKAGATEDDDQCVFCEEVGGSTPSPLTLHRGDRCFVILNKYPYANGHLMVVPRRHIGRLSEAAPGRAHRADGVDPHG